MILDAQGRFSNAQTVTTGSGSGSTPGVVSTNLVDLIAAAPYWGNGQPIYIVGLVTTAMTSSGSNDPLDVNLYSDADPAWGSPTFVRRLFTFPAVSAAGTSRIAVIPPGEALERYLGLYYLSQTSDALTAGAFTVFLTGTPDAWVAPASGYTVL